MDSVQERGSWWIRSAYAVVGFGWMGRVHTQAYARVPHHYPLLGLRPELVTVAEEVPGRAEEAAAQFGFASTTRDWREVAADPRVQAVSITAPNFLHREIGVAMAAAGKHIWIEKPVGLTVADARAVADAVTEAGVHGAVGFNYRNAPAGSGDGPVSDRLRRHRHGHPCPRPAVQRLRGTPRGGVERRYERERGGSGVLGDLASHGADLARHLLGDITSLTADTAIFVPERAVPPVSPPATAVPPAANSARWRTRTMSTACCASPPAPAAFWRPAGSRSASRTTTASRCTAPRARCSGTSAG
ncbi:Inositol 2-dehydrogenase/D-chiro-inositol 3-dehydrogenase [Streptomyces alboniger]